MSHIYVHDFFSPPKTNISLGSGSLQYDQEFMARIASALLGVIGDGAAPGDGLWANIVSGHSGLVSLARALDYRGMHNLFENIYTSMLTVGFQQDAIIYQSVKSSNGKNDHILHNFFDKLISLAEYMQVVPIQNPEQPNHQPFDRYSAQDLIDGISERLGFAFVPPSYQHQLYGLETSAGVFTDRHIIALFVALRIRDIVGTRGRICEIGAGMGYIAYYCRQLGIEDYTIIDLPTVNAVQAFSLGSALGPSRVSLSGEDRSASNIKILGPTDSVGDFDLLVNCDSFPEMGTETMKDYLSRKNFRKVLSCNQESMVDRLGPHDILARVGDTVREIGGFRRLERSRFWMRKGYVDEVYELV